MQFTKWLLMATLLVSVRAFAGVEAVSCDDVFQTVSAREAEPYQNDIAALKARFIKPNNPRTDLIYDRLTRSIDSVTMVLARVHSHSYPFSYIAEGTILRLRAWAKTGDKEHLEEIEKWLKRYKTYPMDRRLLVERTLFVRNEAALLKNAIDANEFPVTLKIPKLIRDGLMKESVTFNSRQEAADELRQLRSAEYLRFNSVFGRNFDNGHFMMGRDYEQAHLEVRLRLLLTEIKKLPLAGRDPELRTRLIAETKELLGDKTLKPTPESRYVEARRAFTDEVQYFTGKREMSRFADELVEGGLFQNDLYDLGVDRERLGPISRFMRGLLVQAPKLATGLLLLSLAPQVQYDVKLLVARQSVMREISELPDRQFAEQSFKFLKTAYGLQDGVLNAKAKPAIARFRELRAEHIKDLREERISEEEYIETMSGDAVEISPEEFKHLMELSPAVFAREASTFVQQKAGGNSRVLARLNKAYATVNSPETERSEDRHLSTDELMKALSGFLVGGESEEAAE